MSSKLDFSHLEDVTCLRQRRERLRVHFESVQSVGGGKHPSL